MAAKAAANSVMDIIYFSNEFLATNIQDLLRRVHNHSKSQEHHLLAAFLRESSALIKAEVQHLPADLRHIIPPFTDVLSWAENTELRQGALCGAVDGVLLVIVQIAAYIGSTAGSDHQSQFSHRNIAGLGIGLLASTAIALASERAHLPHFGAQAVRLAFRLGIHVSGVSRHLEARDPSEKPDTWAYVVHGVEPSAVQAELDKLSDPTRIAQTGKIFISAFSQTSVTVSGPPAALKALFNKSEFFRRSRFIELPVYGGLCHAPHVYNRHDILAIVHGCSSSPSGGDCLAYPEVFSTSTGEPYRFTHPIELYESVVSELLTKSIHWENVMQSLAAKASCSITPDAELTIRIFGNSLAANELQAAVETSIPGVKRSTIDLLQWITDDGHNDGRPRGPAQSKIAIVGMSCRLPGGATSTEKFWDILEQGLDVSRVIPPDRFDVDSHYDPTGKEMNKTMTRYGCFIEEPGMFDAPFFNMSPREAQVVDPQMRLALVTAYEALEQSGYVGNRTLSTQLERIGTYYGQAADDYREVNQGQEVNTYYIPGGCRAFGPGRINYFFKFAGPSYSIDTACSSGLAAIEVACQALWSGTVDTAVTGGVNVLTNPDGFAGLCSGHFLTKGHNACKTWDATADGYCRADGVGSLVLKRLEDAEADNDKVLGVILAAGTNHSAQAVSITHPHAGHQAFLARQTLRQAGVDPLDVSYVELHGTGTQAGDHEEMQGILDVYAPLIKRRSKDQPLHIGAVKANVGHGESVAGTTALIKVLLMLQKSTIPQHIGIKTAINPKFPKDFEKRNLHIPFEARPWPQSGRDGRKRIAAINNFGAAGGNTTMLLEEAPVRQRAATDPRPTHVVGISAKTKASLASNVDRMIAHLDVSPTTTLSDLAYTSMARRYHHSYRIALPTTDVQHLRRQLVRSLEDIDAVKPVGKTGAPQVAFAFTGQGASHRSMNVELFHDVPAFREHLIRLDSLARGQGFPSFLPALDGSHPFDHAHSPVVTQLALVCLEIGLAKYWASLGILPDIVVGHSLGEYAAMHAAGVITASDAIFMVGRRAQLLQDKCTIGSHTMMAVRASLPQIKQSLERKPTVACINGPADTVLSGTKEEMAGTKILLEAVGYRCINLDVAFAFHSEQTDPILDEFDAVAKGVVFQEPNVPLISPLLGRVVCDEKSLNANYVRRATRETVDFLAALGDAHATSAIDHSTVWVEIGPHPVCAAFIKSILPTVDLLALPSMRRNESNWTTIASTTAALHLAGAVVDWNEFHRPFEAAGMLHLLHLPSYAFNDKNYWLRYNGDWCLTKGNTFYRKQDTMERSTHVGASELRTSTVHQIIDFAVNERAGQVVIHSDLMQPDFLAAANGHRMNNCGVVTSSIHADIAYTLAEYLCRKLGHNAQYTRMNIANLVVTKGLVAQSSQATMPQLIQVTAKTADIDSGIIDLTWQNVDNNSTTLQDGAETFATAKIWLSEGSLDPWVQTTYLVQHRMETLEQLAAEGKASRFSRGMAYTLFAKNLVDYEDKYRGMQSVVLLGLEGFADVRLTEHVTGTWTVAPFFIDSVAHLAGFIMNCSDAMDTSNNYCVTPGWDSMCFSKPLVAGAKYRSYVNMVPIKGDATGYKGDVYVFQDDEIVGMVGGIKFHRYPRILLDRFFSPPDKVVADGGKRTTTVKSTGGVALSKDTVTTDRSIPAAPESASDAGLEAEVRRVHNSDSQTLPPVAVAAAAISAAVGEEVVSTTTTRALNLIASESGMDVGDLRDDSVFANLGVDSLLSLVISEKFRTELDVQVSGSLFLDYPTIGDLKKWLDEYYP